MLRKARILQEGKKNNKPLYPGPSRKGGSRDSGGRGNLQRGAAAGGGVNGSKSHSEGISEREPQNVYKKTGKNKKIRQNVEEGRIND